MLAIARAAGLAAPADLTAVQWVGHLVQDGHIAHGPQGGGDRQPGLFWTQHELSRVSDFRITPSGRGEADRMRRQRHEDRTDEVLGLNGLTISWDALTDAQRRALHVPLTNLRAALDDERNETAVGCAKELAEAACKLAAGANGQPVPASASIGSLVKLALGGRPDVGGEDVARRLGGVLDALGALRNEVGTGHGRAERELVNAEVAGLAAAAACAIARFVLCTSS